MVNKSYPKKNAEKLWTEKIINKYKGMRQRVVDFLPEDKTCSIIDFGCGAGNMAKILYDNGYKNYIGIDVNENMLKVAKERVSCCAEKFILKDLTDEATWKLYKDKDVFISTEVLEHIPEDMLVVKSIPSGKLVIISVPNFPHRNHIRHFTSEEKVINRYGSILDFISEVELIRNTYIFKAVKKCL